MDYVGGVGARGPPSLPPSLARSPSRSLSLRLKSHCSCELFSPLIRSLSYKMKKGYRVRVRTFVCVCVCVHGRRLHTGSETMGASRPSQEPESSATAAPAGTHQREREKSHSAPKPYFTFGFSFFLLFCLVSRRSLVLPTLSCRTSAPSLPLSSSCNVSRLSHFTPVPLSASSSSLSH